ncbi:MAG TPA: hypothetical protein VFZ83_04305 [Acidimicrobiia bacterium]|nr:hypothetical protein [Acidimicrobiia bacterium]
MLRGERGVAAIELAFGIAVLLLPVIVLVGTLPVWVDHREAAVAAAREAAVVAARDFPDQDPTAADRSARRVLADHGVPATSASIDVRPAAERGDTVDATVRVEVPALHVPLIGSFGAWTVTVVASRRVEDHRSR